MSKATPAGQATLREREDSSDTVDTHDESTPNRRAQYGRSSTDSLSSSDTVPRESHIAPPKCPECGGETVEGNNERHCEDCGLVLSADHIDHGQEWRAYNQKDKSEKSRVGMPLKASMHDRGLSTQIGYKSSSSSDSRSPDKTERLRLWNNRSKQNDATDRNLIQAFGEIKRLGSELDLPEDTVETACVLYRRIVDEEMCKGRSIEGMATAATLIATRQSGIPRSMNKFCEYSRVKRKRINSAYSYICQEFSLEVAPPEVMDYVPKAASAVGVPKQLETLAEEVLETAISKNIHSGKDPNGLASAALYTASMMTLTNALDDEPDLDVETPTIEAEMILTQTEVAEGADVCDLTIRKRYRELLRCFDITPNRLNPTRAKHFQQQLENGDTTLLSSLSDDDTTDTPDTPDTPDEMPGADSVEVVESEGAASAAVSVDGNQTTSAVVSATASVDEPATSASTTTEETSVAAAVEDKIDATTDTQTESAVTTESTDADADDPSIAETVKNKVESIDDGHSDSSDSSVSTDDAGGSSVAEAVRNKLGETDDTETESTVLVGATTHSRVDEDTSATTTDATAGETMAPIQGPDTATNHTASASGRVQEAVSSGATDGEESATHTVADAVREKLNSDGSTDTADEPAEGTVAANVRTKVLDLEPPSSASSSDSTVSELVAEKVSNEPAASESPSPPDTPAGSALIGVEQRDSSDGSRSPPEDEATQVTATAATSDASPSTAEMVADQLTAEQQASTTADETLSESAHIDSPPGDPSSPDPAIRLDDPGDKEPSATCPSGSVASLVKEKVSGARVNGQSALPTQQPPATG